MQRNFTLALRDFVDTVKADRDFHFIQARGRANANWLKTHELRTKKNNYVAAAWDILGNVTVLTHKLTVMQLTEGEFIHNIGS